MQLKTDLYSNIAAGWPTSGRHLLAQFNDETVVVYQAFSPAIADHAVRHQQFGGDFKFTRMSWIKPNFLWMMYRSGWASKPGQERVLSVSVSREGFETILGRAVPSTFDAGCYRSHEAWRQAVDSSDVRLQWDPDHDPSGAPLERRPIQLGLRGQTLADYATRWVRNIDDITPFVREQARLVQEKRLDALRVPIERGFDLRDKHLAVRMGLERCHVSA